MTSLVSSLIMLVGSYGTASDSTLHVYDFNPADGSATCIQAIDGTANPSFLISADSGNSFFTANENFGADASVTLFEKDCDGRFSAMTTAPTGADGPCHIAIAPNREYVVTANYGARSISVIPFYTDTKTFGEVSLKHFDGSGPVKGRQDSSHPHFTSFTPDGKLMIVDDLGTDRIHIFPLDNDGFPKLDRMQDVEIEAGSGPRHLVFSPDGRFAYLINEISGTISQLLYDKDNLTLIPVSTTFADYWHGEGSGDIRLSPDGRFLYVSNRLKGDGIVCFEINPDDGALSLASFTPTGKHPRNFNLTPDGHWLIAACRDDNRLEIYRRNPSTGTLTLRNTIPCPHPVCVEFMKESNFHYISRKLGRLVKLDLLD